MDELNPTRALIFRITHRDNLSWILKHGLHCRRSATQDPNFVSIGRVDLIDTRHHQIVHEPPGGFLSDYIPFYFTPLSMMAFNIKTGRSVERRDNGEIVILVTSLRRLRTDGIQFLFTDVHASAAEARFSSELSDLDRIDWSILQNRDFERNNEDLGKTSRYQAEALVFHCLPKASLLGIACHDQAGKGLVNKTVNECGLDVSVLAKPSWYFS